MRTARVVLIACFAICALYSSLLLQRATAAKLNFEVHVLNAEHLKDEAKYFFDITVDGNLIDDRQIGSPSRLSRSDTDPEWNSWVGTLQGQLNSEIVLTVWKRIGQKWWEWLEPADRYVSISNLPTPKYSSTH